jgi:Sulfotransferase family
VGGGTQAGPAVTGPPRDAAIFVGGLPRSGTSLMRDILGSHPDVAMFLGELPLWRELASAHAGRNLARAADRDALIRDLVTHPRMQQAQMALDGDELAAALAREPAVSLGTVFAHALRHYARREGKARWGVKDPRNEFHADQILAEFPAARIVHMLRDPRDVIASQRAMWGSRAQHIVSTTHDWRRSAALARRHQAVHRGAYAVVRYEDLVLDPARVVRELCGTLDLDYRPAMLDLAAKPRGSEGEGDDSRRAGPGSAIWASRVARHLRDLAPGEARYVEWRARREMDDWGYARATPAARGGRARIARCLAEEGAWRLLRSLQVWAPIARALGRLPRDRG